MPKQLSEKTRLEQEAGRAALRRILLDSRAEDFTKSLQGKFPNSRVRVDYFVTTDLMYITITNLETGSAAQFSEAAEEFPSDVMMTQIMLVA